MEVWCGVVWCGAMWCGDSSARAYLLVEHSILQLLRAFPVRTLDDPFRLLGRHDFSTIQILCSGVQRQGRQMHV